MKRNSSVHVRLPSSLRKDLERAAISDQRSLSSLIVVILGDWMKAQKVEQRS